MELKSGYKQTEVGMIPEDWGLCKLDSISSVTSGKRLPLGRSLTDKETPHPYIRVTDMREGTVDLGEMKFVPEDVFPSIKNYRIFKEDIYISVAGSLGMVGKIPKELDGANLTENADRISSISCSRDFLLYILKSPLVQDVIDSIQTVGAQPKLALARIRDFLIPLPPTKAEQEAIAEALSDADALIASLEKLIAKKRLIKQGAMQELLTGKRRLPGFSGDWEEKMLGELGKCYRGVSYSPSDLSEGDTSSTVRLLRANNVQNSSIVFSDMQYVDAARVSEHQSLREKDVLVCMANGSRQLVGKAGQFVSSDGYEYTFGAFMAAFRPNTAEADSDYVFMLFSTEAYRNHIDLLLAGSSINNLTPSSVEELQLLMPQTDEQTAIAKVLSEMDEEINALETKLAKARLLKQGMMQELLTGRIRLV